MKKRLLAIFHGEVQGVGFRANVQSWASGLGLEGWVRNNPDGSVELEAEGEEGKLQKLLQEISQSHLQRYITKTETSWNEAVRISQRSDLSDGVTKTFQRSDL